MATATLTKTQKIATLLASLGSERAAAVLEHLHGPSASAITHELAQMGPVPAEVQRAVLREFRRLVSNEDEKPALPGHAVHARLADLPPATLGELLADEPPHLAALLLLGFPPALGAAVLAALPATLQPTVAQQMGSLTPPAAEVRALLESAVYAKATRRRLHAQTEGRRLLATMAPPPPPPPAPDGLTLADIATLSQALLAPALTGLEIPLLETALRGADSSVRQTVLAALPFRRRMAVSTRLKGPQPVTVREVLDAQRHLLAAVRETLAAREETPHA